MTEPTPRPEFPDSQSMFALLPPHAPAHAAIRMVSPASWLTGGPPPPVDDPITRLADSSDRSGLGWWLRELEDVLRRAYDSFDRSAELGDEWDGGASSVVCWDLPSGWDANSAPLSYRWVHELQARPQATPDQLAQFAQQIAATAPANTRASFLEALAVLGWPTRELPRPGWWGHGRFPADRATGSHVEWYLDGIPSMHELCWFTVVNRALGCAIATLALHPGEVVTWEDV